jgi:hypothetical protein
MLPETARYRVKSNIRAANESATALRESLTTSNP